MTKKEVTTYEITCDRCGKRIEDRKGNTYVKSIHFETEEYEMQKLKGFKPHSYEDLCRNCSGIFLAFMEQKRKLKMTQKQYDSFKNWRYHTAGWNMTNCAEWARDDKIPADKAMLAWLYPEDIKIIEENEE